MSFATVAQSLVTRLQAGWPGFDSWQGLGFPLATVSRLARGPTQPPIQWLFGSSFPGVDWSGHELPSSTEVKDVWSCTSTPPILLRGVVLN